MKSIGKVVKISILLTGTKQSYGEPQNLTEFIREALKDKKPIADKSSDKVEEKTATSNESDEDVKKKRSKI